MSAVVVDLPLVPVMATTLPGAPCFARSRQNSSMSPITSTPAASARTTAQFGSGWVRGMPGREHERGEARPVDRREIAQNEPGGQRLGPALLVVVPGEHIGAAGFERAHGGDAAQAQALDRYVAAGKDRHGNHSEWNLAQFQRGEASKRKHHGDDPEPDHHGRFGPALLLEMVMQGRHAEHAHAE